MRLIDADALIQDLIDKEISFNADVNEAILNAREIGGYADYVDRVWEIAYERGKEEAFQWIPCPERLPDKSVLCCDKYGEIMIGHVYKDDVESDTGYSAENDQELMYDCIAWMPLPPSYRGDDK